jgi:hypothetical protein
MPRTVVVLARVLDAMLRPAPAGRPGPDEVLARPTVVAG